jgi:uncharacterized protein (DUF58 family)
VQLIRNIYLPDRFFQLFGAVIALFVLAHFLPFLFPVAQAIFVLAMGFVVFDSLLLFRKKVPLEGKRTLPQRLSLGDENQVRIWLRNRSSLHLSMTIIDELPYQLQKRDFELNLLLSPDEQRVLSYTIRPTVRGEYAYGSLNVYATSVLGLVERRIVLPLTGILPVYPSILQMKRFELKAFQRISSFDGLKKQRRLGHSYEFEQIKNYVRGDDFRSINWKATSRRNELMVNQYEDERAQQIYCIIDKSRVMRMPFNGLSLLDYAINSALVVSNIALKKYDRAGLISFSDKLGSAIKADRRPNQLNLILNALYNEKERNLESNYELLYQAVSNLISGRSLIMLYTNFESKYALERVLPLLRKIGQRHLLVVVFFENTEIEAYAKQPAQNVEQIYKQTVAQKMLLEKQQMVQTLKQYGIQAILTAPENLSLNTVNKYLELKARGLI